jgi:Cdc6-like AAA superfamily ATPase
MNDDDDDSRIRQEIASWLSPIDYGPHQRYLTDTAQEGTGEFVFSSPQFTKWINFDQPRQTLHLLGAPGAGKTVTVSTVVHRLQCQFSGDPQVGLAFIYCGYQRGHERMPIQLLLNLLRQLVIIQNNVPDNVKRLYQSCRMSQKSPVYSEVFQVLCAVASEYSTIFVIVDGLDESEMPDSSQKIFLDSLSCLQANADVRILLTTPLDWDTKINSKHILSIDIYCEDDEIEQYFRRHISGFPGSVSLTADLQQRIKTTMKEIVNGK